MARKRNIYTKLMKLAKIYQVQDNELFISAAKQYAVQQKVIDNINEILSESDDLMTKKEYVKGRENVYSHPLVKELPKHSDSANKTANTMLEIIKTFGCKEITGSKLESFLNE